MVDFSLNNNHQQQRELSQALEAGFADNREEGGTQLSEERIREAAMKTAMIDSDTSSMSEEDAPETANQIAINYTQAEERIRRYGEANERRRAAYAQQRERIQSVVDLSREMAEGTPVEGLEELEDARSAFREVAQQRAAEREQAAAEELFNDRMTDLALTDPGLADAIRRNEEFGGALETMHRREVARSILAREIDLAIEESGMEVHRPFRMGLFTTLDFIFQSVPFIESTGQTGNLPSVVEVGPWAWLFPEGQIRREAQALHDPTLSAEEIRRRTQELVQSAMASSNDFGYQNVTQQNDIIRYRRDSRDAGLTNELAFFDNFLGLPIVGAVKGSVNLPTLLARRGARNRASQVIANMTNAVNNGNKVDDLLGTLAQPSNAPVAASDDLHNVITETLPDLVNPTTSGSRAGMSGLILENVERGERLVREVLGELSPTARRNPEEVQALVDRALQETSERLNRDIVLNVNGRIDSMELSTGAVNRSLVVEVGKKNGEDFARRQDAVRYLNSLGLSDQGGEVVEGVFTPRVEGARDGLERFLSAEPFQIPGEQGWRIRITSDIPETGSLSVGLESPLPSNATAGVFRWTSSARGIMDERLQGAALLSGNRRNAIESGMRSMAEPLRNLKGSQRADLNTVLALGRDAPPSYLFPEGVNPPSSMWFNDQQLREVYRRQLGREATTNELVSYHATRNIFDMEYALRNDAYYSDLLDRNFQQITVGSDGLVDDMVGRVLDNPNQAPYQEVYFPERNGIISRDEVAAHLAREDSDYVLVSLADEINLGDGTMSRYVLSRRTDVQTGPLARTQLAYNPGGHRMYEGRYFSKQAVIQNGSGMNPRTYIVGRTKAEVDEWNGVMERARLAFIDGADADALDDILGGGRGYPSGQAFIDGMESGLYRRDVAFETLFDREIPEAYKNVGGSGRPVGNVEEIGDSASAGLVDLHRTRGQMYYGNRGDVLPDFNGDQGAVFDVYRTIDRSIANISQTAGFDAYKREAVERWLATYGGDTNADELIAAGAPPWRVFEEARWTSSRSALQHAAEAQRDVINRVLNWKSPGQIQEIGLIRGLSEWLGDRGMRKSAQWLIEEGARATPISWMRGLAFDLKLGMFNVAQFPLQISTILAATSIDPVRGMQAMMGLPMIRRFYAESVENLDAALEGMVRRNAHKSMGFEDVAEFRAYMMDARHSGFLDVSAQATSDLGRQTEGGISSALGGPMQSLREAGRIPFNEAERWNRIVGRHIAWRRVREQMPDLAYDSPDFRRRVALLQDDMTINMQRESQAAWQQGLLGIPTQFWSYSARMTEMLVGKQLTAAEKIRLGLGQFFFYGTTGIPMASFASDFYRQEVADGEVGELGTFRGFIERGALDHMIWGLSGGEADILIGKRLGVGEGLTSIVRDAFNMGEFGSTSTAEMLLGATGGIIGEGTYDIFQVLRWASVEAMAQDPQGGGMPLTERAVQNLLANASSFSNGLKAYMAFNSRTLVSGSGTTLAGDLNAWQAAALIFSFQPGATEELSARMDWMRNRRDAIDELARIRSRLMSRFVNANSHQEREDILHELSAFTRLSVPDEFRSEVFEKTYISPDMLSGFRVRQPIQAAQDRAIREGSE